MLTAVLSHAAIKSSLPRWSSLSLSLFLLPIQLLKRHKKTWFIKILFKQLENCLVKQIKRTVVQSLFIMV